MSIEKRAKSNGRKAFYDRIGRFNLAPLWTELAKLITPEPRSRCQAAGWRFADIRKAMIEAGSLITAEEAERRVLVLENPGLRGQSKITTDLYAGVQMILPRETAPSHRHSQGALRFVLEGDGAYTIVGGERIVMHPGDLVLTPPMSWHEHGNETNRPMFWLDGLDIPLVQMLDASFFERPNSRTSMSASDRSRTSENSAAPVQRRGTFTPEVCVYPYAQTRQLLDLMRSSQDCDACHGFKMQYGDAQTGAHILATIGAFIQVLPKEFVTQPYRSTDATVFVVVEGRGCTRIGDAFSFAWAPNDVFVVPSWRHVIHEADESAVLFSFSDRPTQEKLGLFREERCIA